MNENDLFKLSAGNAKEEDIENVLLSFQSDISNHGDAVESTLIQHERDFMDVAEKMTMYVKSIQVISMYCTNEMLEPMGLSPSLEGHGGTGMITDSKQFVETTALEWVRKMDRCVGLIEMLVFCVSRKNTRRDSEIYNKISKRDLPRIHGWFSVLESHLEHLTRS